MTAEKADLDATGLVALMMGFRDRLSVHEQTINRLNVFPVPDGDTGTNMRATVDAAMAEIETLEVQERTIDAIGAAIGHGSLMGARGNSGVILCQILRGFSQQVRRGGPIGAEELSLALTEASTGANAAVLRPVKGTILTVAEDAAVAASKAVTPGAALIEVAAIARQAAVESLWRTPQYLAVLAEAGVVDAGGAGLLCFFDALLSVVSGRAVADRLELPDGVAERVALGGAQDISPVAELLSLDDNSGYRYEVMYLLDAPDDAIGAFKDAWGTIGDSIVVVGGEGLYNCHVHTNDIGAAIEAAIDVGRPREIRVSDLNEQVEEERWVRTAERDEQNGSTKKPPPRTSVVTVGTGEGIRRVFRSLGVDSVVHGGQSMNPSTAEILQMIDEAPGKEVVVLPNNTNIYPVAAQAAELSDKVVFVVPTAGIPEGFAALLEYDPQAGAEQNAGAMTEAAARVVCGEVTQAVRAVSTPRGEVTTGDFIGLSRSGIESVAANLADATTGLLTQLLAPGHEIVTLIQGIDVGADDLRRVTEWISDEYPGITCERVQGDQPLYPFFISIE